MPKLKIDKQTASHQSRMPFGAPTLHYSITPVWVSQTESRLVQPNPTTPSPPGKEIGKETVKFLAIFTTTHHLQTGPKWLARRRRMG
jgi:hypothetical protein